MVNTATVAKVAVSNIGNKSSLGVFVPAPVLRQCLQRAGLAAQDPLGTAACRLSQRFWCLVQ